MQKLAPVFTGASLLRYLCIRFPQGAVNRNADDWSTKTCSLRQLIIKPAQINLPDMGYQVWQLCYIHVYYYMCIHKRLSDEQVRQLLQQINIMLGVPWCLNFAIFTFEKPFFTLKLHILLSSHLLTIHLHFFSLHSSDFHNSSFLQTYKTRSSFFEKDRYPPPCS